MIVTPPTNGPYSPVEFWATVGDWYESTCDHRTYQLQEAAIAAVLESLEWNSVLDVGCGFGRLGMLIQRIRPKAIYHGIDICEGLLRSARRHLPSGTFKQTAIMDYRRGGAWDLVITAEVLMHQPAVDIRKIISRLFRWSNRWVVNCDWDDIAAAGNAWNIPHDYLDLYGDRLVSVTPAGVPRQSIFLADAT